MFKAAIRERFPAWPRAPLSNSESASNSSTHCGTTRRVGRDNARRTVRSEEFRQGGGGDRGCWRAAPPTPKITVAAVLGHPTKPTKERGNEAHNCGRTSGAHALQYAQRSWCVDHPAHPHGRSVDLPSYGRPASWEAPHTALQSLLPCATSSAAVPKGTRAPSCPSNLGCRPRFQRWSVVTSVLFNLNPH